MDNVIVVDRLDEIMAKEKDTSNMVNVINNNVAAIIESINNIKSDINNVANNQQKIWLMQPSDTTLYSTNITYKGSGINEQRFYLAFSGNYRVTGASVSNYYGGEAQLLSYTIGEYTKTKINSITVGTNTIVYLEKGWHCIYHQQTSNQSSTRGIHVEVKGSLVLDDISNCQLSY